MQAHEPDFLLSHYVYDLPVSSLCVKLLDGGAVREGLITHGVNVALSEGATVGTADRLGQLGQGLLPLCCQVEGFTLSKVSALKRATNYIYVVLLLRDAKVYPIIHHLSKGFEFPLWDIKLYNLRAWHIA